MDTFYERMAANHRVKAAAADTSVERDHWLLEAERFDILAAVAKTDSAEARAMYRPTRAYQPAES